MKKLNKQKVYNIIYDTPLESIDKNLSIFLKNKKLISKQSKKPPDEFEY